MDFNLEDFCKDNGLDFPVIKRCCDLYVANVIKISIQHEMQGASEKIREEIKRIVSDSAKSASAKSGGKNKAATAPCREEIVCYAQISKSGGGYGYEINFMSVEEMPYGVFCKTVYLSEEEILSYFFTESFLSGDMSNSVRPMDVIPGYDGIFSDYTDVLRSVMNVQNYHFVLDVKRKTASSSAPVEAISIKPLRRSNLTP